MKTIKIIKFQNKPEQKKYRKRKSTRAVVFDNEGKIAILSVTKHEYHKIPGGGIEKGENIKTALERECLEEIGCKIEIIKELGLITEYRDQFKIVQSSYGYVAKVKGKKGNPDFTKDEIADGFKLKWINLEKAIKLLEADSAKSYSGKFIRIRDLVYLKEAKKYI
jgi:ADP-ribose pyrophosphatase YjhB (NUDIX family)